MQNQLTEQDIKNTISLINAAPIKGNEAMTVALLVQKLTNMLTPIGSVTTKEEIVTPEEPKTEKTNAKKTK